MSLKFKTKNGWVLDHLALIRQSNSKVQEQEKSNIEIKDNYYKCCLNVDFFEIKSPFIRDIEAVNLAVSKLKRKRNRSSMENYTNNKVSNEEVSLHIYNFV